MSYEARQVDHWRSLGRSWQTIAENLKRCVIDVRRDYDRSFTGYAPAPYVPVEPLRERPVIKRLSSYASPGRPPAGKRDPSHSLAQEMRILSILYHAEGWVSLSTHKDNRANGAVKRLRAKYGRGIWDSSQHHGFKLTAEGRALYERLVQTQQVAA